MAIKTPHINIIIRMSEWDLLHTAITEGNMYMCTDSQTLYYDETTNKRVVYYYVGVRTVNDLLYNITPTMNTTYYCWEDNSLWLWMNKWLVLWTNNSYPSAYAYNNSNVISPIYIKDGDSIILDNNGLLGDGSVVIRDGQRIIKGKISIDNTSDNMVISSYFGGGIRILPNGSMSGEGELLIADEGPSHIRSEFHIFNNQMYIDYSEDPSSDPSEYPNDSHIYEVYHQGNLDASAIKVLTPLEIYNKLLDTSLPDPLDFNVSKLNGKTSNDFAPIVHTHTASQITDFNEKARTQAQIEVNTIFNTMQGEGIDITYNASTSAFKLSANSFRLSFIDGATGSGIVNSLSNTSISLTVDPNKHIHQNYLDTMESLQTQINDLSNINLDNYYNKTEVNNKIADIQGTAIPTVNKPLLINSNLKLPATATAADKLSSTININLTGAITGTVSSNLDSDVTIETDASNILSSTPVTGKALLIDTNGDLPANAITATALNHKINLELSGDIIGSAEIDTNTNSVLLTTSVSPTSNILNVQDIGIKVASLNENGKIPSSQLPDTSQSLSPQGEWNPNTGTPSSDPSEGQFWIANTKGTFDNIEFNIGDWCLYLDSKWQKVSPTQSVNSVNGQVGNVELTANDIDAISNTYTDYTLGDIIPANKIVITADDGKIVGASVETLTNAFSLESQSEGDVIFSSNSSNTSTNGSNNLNVEMQISETGYENIKNNTGYVIQSNGSSLDHKLNLNFGQGFNITEDENSYNIEPSNYIKVFTQTIGDGTSTTFNCEHNLESDNIIVQFRDTDGREIQVDNTIASNNLLNIDFGNNPPAINSIKVIIFAI